MGKVMVVRGFFHHLIAEKATVFFLSPWAISSLAPAIIHLLVRPNHLLGVDLWVDLGVLRFLSWLRLLLSYFWGLPFPLFWFGLVKACSAGLFFFFFFWKTPVSLFNLPRLSIRTNDTVATGPLQYRSSYSAVPVSPVPPANRAYNFF
jgi:hypothetical protein